VNKIKYCLFGKELRKKHLFFVKARRVENGGILKSTPCGIFFSVATGTKVI